MPIIKSAKKALRVSFRKRAFNDKRKKALKDAIKKIEKLVEANQKADALKSLPLAYSTIDKAAKKGVIKKNNASRKKSRLAKLVK